MGMARAVTDGLAQVPIGPVRLALNFPELYCEPKPVQQPHPQVSIANASEEAMQHIAAYGDGWIARSDLADVKTIEASRRRLEALFKEDGRDFSRFEVTLFGCKPERAAHRSFADAGVDRILQIVKHEPPQETENSLTRWAETLL
jgi:alkanesulfonate monooxygenase SsuD/methylene tetrahydromethanopterin reductase-like flavin-dependent oxidoreductase (luciferase family)